MLSRIRLRFQDHQDINPKRQDMKTDLFRFPRVCSSLAQSRWMISSVLLLVLLGGLTSPGQAIEKPYPDIGAISRPVGKGVARIIPMTVDTAKIPVISEAVRIYADFKPSIFNGKPTTILAPGFTKVVRGWYEATVQIDDPYWEAVSAKVPVYLNGMPIISFDTLSSTVDVSAGSVVIKVRSDGLCTEKAGFVLRNGQNITVDPADQVLDFSRSTEAFIRLSWPTSGKNIPLQNSVGLVLNPQGSFSFTSQQNEHTLRILPKKIEPSAPGADMNGFSSVKVEVPASLPQPVVIAPSVSASVHTLKISGALFFRDVDVSWNPEITLVQSVSNHAVKSYALVPSTDYQPTSELYFSVPAGVTPIFEIQARTGYVKPGEKKTVILSLVTDKTDDAGNILSTARILNKTMRITFVSDAPSVRDDSFAFRSVTLVLNRKLDVLKNDIDPKKQQQGLFIASIQNRPDLSVTPDSLQILYTLPQGADSALGYTDSFTYTVSVGGGVSKEGTVYVTVADPHTVGDSVRYSAETLTGQPTLTAKPAFYGKYMPINKSSLKKITLKNSPYRAADELEFSGARAQLTARTLLIDQKLRKDKKTGNNARFFADIADSVQLPALGLQLFAKTKVTTPAGVAKHDAPLAAWVIVPPQPDTYRLIRDTYGDSYLVVWCRFAGNKTKAFFETIQNGKIKKIPLRVMKSITLQCCAVVKSENGLLILKMPKTIPTSRADLIIDSGNGLGFVRDFDFAANTRTDVPPASEDARL